MNHLGNRLAAYVDGELPCVTRELITAHLAMCSSCRLAVEQETRIKQGLTGLGAPDPSPDLMGALLHLAEPGEPLPPRRRPLGPEPVPAPVPVGRPVRVAFLGIAEPAVPYDTRGSKARRSLLAAGALGIAAVTLASAHAQQGAGNPKAPASSYARFVGGTSATTSENVEAVFDPNARVAPEDGPNGVPEFYGHVQGR